MRIKWKTGAVLVSVIAVCLLFFSCGRRGDSETVKTGTAATQTDVTQKESERETEPSAQGESSAAETQSTTEKKEQTAAASAAVTTKKKAESASTQKAAQRQTEKLVISEKADYFYQNSVFVGDSVMTGLMYYVMRQEKGFLGNPDFLALGSFSAFWNLQPVTDSSIHPVYQGVKGTIEDHLQKINPKRVILFFGINDLGMSGLEKTIDNYKEVIKRILAKNPKVEIYVLSTTNMYKGSDKDRLNNKNIDKLNAAMKSYCQSKGYGYIDLASYLVGSDGTLLEEYSSDHYVHQTNAAYQVWVKVLRSYATEQMRIAEEESRKAAEQASREQASREQASREQASREQASREQASREQASREQASREQASREQASREEESRREESTAETTSEFTERPTEEEPTTVRITEPSAGDHS